MEEKTKDLSLLIATFNGASEKPQCEEHLQELALLADTYGVEIVEKIACPLRKIEAATFLGKGKLQELVEKAHAAKINVVIIDEEISPAQQRNLEEAFKLPVMDRTELILNVFEQRAKTREARLQVELAKVKYQSPRLKRLWTHLSRQTGSGGAGVFVKGEGEKQIEIDRRLLQTQIEKLEEELLQVAKHRRTQRTARKRNTVPTFAIIGYTNVGKSTLMNALTDAGVFVEDKLFATLDTTTRKYTLPNNQDILLIDTVGFIRKLPHLLVAAFKSTLEESMEADILLHLIDVSHPAAMAQAEASLEVLKELNAQNKPVITVLNKVDRLENPSDIFQFRLKFPHTVTISATERLGFDELAQMMIDGLKEMRRTVTLRIPQSDYAIVSQLREVATIYRQDYEENDVLIQAEVPLPLMGRLRAYLQEE